MKQAGCSERTPLEDKDRLPWNAGFKWRHVVVMSVAAAIALIGGYGVHSSGQTGPVQLATDVGIALSMLGVVGAVTIFARQSAQNDLESTRHAAFMLRTETTLMAMMETDASLKHVFGERVYGFGSEEAPKVDAQFSGGGTASAQTQSVELSESPGEEGPDFDEESDGYPAETLGLQTQNGEVIVYDPKDVKLWMLAAVVRYWDGQGTAGRWNLSALRGAAQKKGHGRNSWFLVFEDPETEELDYYRVSTGGRGKTEPTVTHMTVGGTNKVLSN
ncbi:hypothetical protein [Rhodococcus coprophilus]|uniref:hypothetical protein n=1 Tax=Rhodococcus coprophilus TaxID=38310 RepID=UPI0033D9919F